MSTRKDWIVERDGRRIVFLHPETREEVGFVNVPENMTTAEALRFIDGLKREAARRGES